MSSHRVLVLLLKHYKTLLSTEAQDKISEKDQNMVMSLVIKIANYNLSLSELRQYLDLFKNNSEYPVLLLESLVTIAKSDLRPTHYCNFEKYVDFFSLHNSRDFRR